jgi:hypothetical protein
MDKQGNGFFCNYSGMNDQETTTMNPYNMMMPDGHHQNEFRHEDNENQGPSGYGTDSYQPNHNDSMNHESTLGDYDDYADESYDPTTTREVDQDPSKDKGKLLVGNGNTTAGSYSYQDNADDHYKMDGHYNEDDYDEKMVEDPSNNRNQFRNETFAAAEDYSQAMTKKNSSASSSYGINETATNNRAKTNGGSEEVDDIYHHNQHQGDDEARGNERPTEEEEEEEEADDNYDETPGSPNSFEKRKVLEDLANLVKEKERNLKELMNKLVEDFTAYVHTYDKNMKMYGKIHANVQKESQRLDRCEEEVNTWLVYSIFDMILYFCFTLSQKCDWFLSASVFLLLLCRSIKLFPE